MSHSSMLKKFSYQYQETFAEWKIEILIVFFPPILVNSKESND
jgi:hypothetical protein